jgi:hypothetical protein
MKPCEDDASKQNCMKAMLQNKVARRQCQKMKPCEDDAIKQNRTKAMPKNTQNCTKAMPRTKQRAREGDTNKQIVSVMESREVGKTNHTKPVKHARVTTRHLILLFITIAYRFLLHNQPHASKLLKDYLPLAPMHTG